jgi:hypothetical protein
VIAEQHTSYLEPKISLVVAAWRNEAAKLAGKKPAVITQVNLGPEKTQDWFQLRHSREMSFNEETQRLEAFCKLALEPA